MGCISSKVVPRSTSFQEELNQSFQRISSNGSNQFLALVCTATLVANKLQSRSLNSVPNTWPESAVKPEITKTSNTWELTTSLEQAGEKKCGQPATPVLPPLPPKVTESIDADLSKQYKSCHWYSEHEVSSLALGSFNGIKEDINRSFHTVEEYDAMVEKFWLPRVQQTRFEGEDDVSQHAEDNGFQEIKQSSVKGKSVIEETCMLLSSGSATIPSLDHTSTIKESNVVDNASQQGNVFQKGSKRKAIAKGLDSLRVPPTIEFPGVASLKEWVHSGGQVYSPGSMSLQNVVAILYQFLGQKTNAMRVSFLIQN